MLKIISILVTTLTVATASAQTNTTEPTWEKNCSAYLTAGALSAAMLFTMKQNAQRPGEYIDIAGKQISMNTPELFRSVAPLKDNVKIDEYYGVATIIMNPDPDYASVIRLNVSMVVATNVKTGGCSITQQPVVEYEN